MFIFVHQNLQGDIIILWYSNVKDFILNEIWLTAAALVKYCKYEERWYWYWQRTPNHGENYNSKFSTVLFNTIAY